MPCDEARARRTIEQALREARRDAFVFSITTILLTPAFLVGAVWIVFVWIGSGYGLRHSSNHRYSVDVVLNGFLLIGLVYVALVVLTRICDRRARSTWLALGLATAFLALLGLLSYATSLRETAPISFWCIKAGVATLMLGMLGHSYEPKDDYYLGWYGSPVVNDPFTFEDNQDRFDLSLGFATMIPNMILSSYAEIFGSSWMLRGLDDRELSLTATTLCKLGEGDAAGAAGTLRNEGKSSVRIVRTLVKLKYVRVAPGKIQLTEEGKQAVGISKWL